MSGLANYERLFNFDRWMRYGEFGSALKITFQFVFGSALLGQAVVGLTVAWAFYRRKGFLREMVFTLAVLAWIVPEAVAAFAWSAYLNVDRGTLNTILSSIGLGKPDWLFYHPMFSIIIFNTWRGSAFSILLFSSALETIPPSYMETADVVGASAWRKFRDILFPLLRGHILTDLILITLWTFNVFTPFLLTGGGPTFKTQLVSIYTYRTAFKFFEFGRGGCDCSRDDADQLHAGVGLSVHAAASKGNLMKYYETPLSKALMIIFSLVCAAFFALPLLWLLTAPFNRFTTLSVDLPSHPTLDNFRRVFDNQFAIRALFRNNLIIAGGAMLSVGTVATLASYGLSRTRLPGKNMLVYVLMLFSSVVGGTAAMVPIFLLANSLGLIDTHIGVILVMTGGFLPAAIFMMRDFVEFDSALV